jgi:hypothetical protein
MMLTLMAADRDGGSALCRFFFTENKPRLTTEQRGASG